MLITRVITAIVMFLMFACLLFLAPRLIWILFCVLVAGGAAYEWSRLIGLSGSRGAAFEIGIALLVFVWPVLALPELVEQTFYAISLVFWIVFVPFWLRNSSMPAGRGVGIAVGALVIVAAGIALIALRDHGTWFLLCILGVIWVSDSAAYFVGSAMGKNKMAPRISPGKTWEGVVGAMVFVTLYSVAWIHFSEGVLPGRLTESLMGNLMFSAMLLLLAILGICGDLFESYLKRVAGVKDSGNLLPGHGGILDRIDALLPALPAAALLLFVLRQNIA